MAPEHPNARPVFPSGVRHANVPHTSHFTVIGNHLAQHRELSLTAIGLAVHIQSLPGGSQVGIRELNKCFTEGEIRIASALRELEHHGYLSRTLEKLPGGKLITRTVSYNHPEARPEARPEPDHAPPLPPLPPPPPAPRRPRPRQSPPPQSPPPASPPPSRPGVRTEEPPAAPDPVAEPAFWYDPAAEPEFWHDPPAEPGAEPGLRRDPESETEFWYDPAAEPEAEPEAEPDRAAEPGRDPESAPEAPAPVRVPAAPTLLSPLPAPEEVIPSRRAAAKALLGRLRRIDQRLLLGERDIHRLAGGVEAWLERGASTDAVITALTATLPERPRNPAGLVAHRLTVQLPPVLGPVYREQAYVAPAPFLNCEDCDLAFRSHTPGKCPGCARESAA
ncbi:hypothetical protein ACFWCB_07925 [Streptomyces sp. NPDC060048]|uniref:hypothetical protein n=1 Tax=unclassified Streptomyces TaxID=2593676 RepID=UPI0036CE1589